MKRSSNEIVLKFHLSKNKKHRQKMIELSQNLVKAENVLATQIRIENVKSANFLYNRRVSKINSSTCFYDHQRKTMKHIIVSCSLSNRTEIKNRNKND